MGLDRSNAVDVDYFIIGAGAAGMAFADTLLTDTDAHILIVDRRHRPGGHWNDAYSFVRLHQPSAYHGVNSRELSQGSKDVAGWNQGLYELAGGAEVLSYFDQVMQQRFLPSGRVQYFPMSDVVGDGEFESLLTGRRQRVFVRNKIVDATYAGTELPSTHPPRYGIQPGVRCVPVNDLPKFHEPTVRYVIVGSGKTGIDACLWLLEQGVATERILWIMPRDAWLLDRSQLQPGDEFFFTAFGSIARQFEALVEADSVEDLFERLEAGGVLLRIDSRIKPTAYRCATVSLAELSQLRRIEGVVRLGRVLAINGENILLERGRVPMPPGALVVDCSANGIPPRPPVPMWKGNRLTLQMVRACQPIFSAALIAHVEATFADEAQKNALCAPIPSPSADVDWLRLLEGTTRNRYAWSKHVNIEQWLANSRLDCFWSRARQVNPADTEKVALLEGYRTKVRPALTNLSRLLARVG